VGERGVAVRRKLGRAVEDASAPARAGARSRQQWCGSLSPRTSPSLVGRGHTTDEAKGLSVRRALSASSRGKEGK